jgi:hypothetical protein
LSPDNAQKANALLAQRVQSGDTIEERKATALLKLHVEATTAGKTTLGKWLEKWLPWLNSISSTGATRGPLLAIASQASLLLYH